MITLGAKGKCRLCAVDLPMIRVYTSTWLKKCTVKSCGGKVTFLVVGDDGKAKMSRESEACCGKHLSVAVRKIEKLNGKKRRRDQS